MNKFKMNKWNYFFIAIALLCFGILSGSFLYRTIIPNTFFKVIIHNTSNQPVVFQITATYGWSNPITIAPQQTDSVPVLSFGECGFNVMVVDSCNKTDKYPGYAESGNRLFFEYRNDSIIPIFSKNQN